MKLKFNDNLRLITINTNTTDAAILSVDNTGQLTITNDTSNIPVRIQGNLILTGDLTVQGTTTTVDTANLNIEDNNIVLNNGEPGTGVTEGTAGITIDRGLAVDATILWQESDDTWDFAYNAGATTPRLTGVGDPVDLTDVSNKNYVDTAVAGASWAWADDDGSAPGVAPSATGTDSIAIGDGAATAAVEGYAIGSSSSLAAGSTRAITIGSFSNSGVTAGTYSITLGSDDSATDNAQATGAQAIAIGSSSGSTGDGARASGANAIAIGGANGASNGALASNTNAIAIGLTATASAIDTIAIGETSTASTGTGNIAIGSDATASGSTGAIAFGDGALASGQSGISIGNTSEADGTNSIGIGTFVNSGITAGAYSIAIGSDDSATDNAMAEANGSIVIGSSQGSTGNGARVGTTSVGSIAIGSGGTSSGNGPSIGTASSGCIAIGSGGSTGSGPVIGNSITNSIVIGSANAGTAGPSTTVSSSTVIGYNANGSGATGAVAIGALSTASSATTPGTAVGYSATASGSTGAVALGRNATANNTSTIAIGQDSTASNTYAIALGRNATASANAAIAIGSDDTSGGASNATASYSIALGANNTADKLGQSIVASAPFFAASGDVQPSLYVASVQTTNGTPTKMTLVDGTTNYLVLDNDSTMMFTIHIVARRTDVNDESAAYRITGCIDRNATAATTVLVGSIVKDIISEDTTTWDVTVAADTTNGGLYIEVTGEAAKTIRWAAFIQAIHVEG